MLRVKNWGAPGSIDEEALKKIITEQLGLIKSRSLDGGFTLWPSQNEWPQRNLLLSIYILDFLLEAQKDGYKVSAEVITQTVNFIQTAMNGETENTGIPKYFSQEAQKTVFVYGLSVLARSGANVAGFLENVYQTRDSSNLVQILHLTRAINSLPRSKERVEQLKTLIGLIVNHIHVGSGQNTIAEVWTDRGRLIGLTLLTLAEAAPYNELIPGLVRSLGEIGRRGHFGSTQNNVTALLALSTYINKAESEKIDIRVTALAKEKEILTVPFDSFVDKPVSTTVKISDLDPALEKIQFLSTGTGHSWATLRLTTAPKEPDLTPVITNGLMLSRSYTVIKPEPQNNPAAVFRRGQVVKVTVTLMTPVERYNLVLEDPLPAGFEAINFSLKDADQTLIPLLNTGNDDNNDGTFQSMWYDHEEFWPDRIVAVSSYLPAGVYTYSYLIRPATPGKYLIPGPKAEEMYSPETFGRGAGQKLTIE
jgi:uncharacterized protein YfaS (alpha-2-macroglobulin family)